MPAWKSGKTGRIWHISAVPGSFGRAAASLWLKSWSCARWGLLSSTRCPRDGGICRGDTVKRGTRPKATGSRARTALQKCRGVKALEVGFSSGWGIRQFKFGLKKPGICKVQERLGQAPAQAVARLGALISGGAVAGVEMVLGAAYSHATRRGSCSTVAPGRPWTSSPGRHRSAGRVQRWGVTAVGPTAQLGRPTAQLGHLIAQLGHLIA